MSAKTEILKTAKFKPGQEVYLNRTGARVDAKVGSVFAYRVAGGWQVRYALLVHMGKYDHVTHAVEHEILAR